MNLGLTGGIACGKSTVSNMFVKLGAALVDADRIAREVVEPDQPGWDAVIRRFGEQIVLPDRSLNRKQLAEIVFHDNKAREDLQSILHPLIRAEMRRQIQNLEENEPSRLVIVDVPLLYESKLQHLFQAVVVVYVDRATQIQRLMERDHLTVEQAEARLRSQLPIEDKRRWADYVIDNRGTVEHTEEQVKHLYETMLKDQAGSSLEK